MCHAGLLGYEGSGVYGWLALTASVSLYVWQDDEAPQALKVREHPKTGPYVEGATSVSVASFEDIKALIDKGNTNR